MTRAEIIFELTEKFQNELEELSTSDLSRLLTATENSSLLSDEFLSEDLEEVFDNEDDDEEVSDDMKDLTLMDDLWEDDDEEEEE